MFRILLAAGALLMANCASAQDATLAGDTAFVSKASVANAFEIKESELVLDKLKDPKLKAFAQRMITDHGDALKKLQAAAGTTGEVQLDAAHQAKVDALAKLDGDALEAAYRTDQIRAHDDAVALLTGYTSNGTNPKLLAWVNEALPVVKMHQDEIKALSPPATQ